MAKAPAKWFIVDKDGKMIGDGQLVFSEAEDIAYQLGHGVYMRSEDCQHAVTEDHMICCECGHGSESLDNDDHCINCVKAALEDNIGSPIVTEYIRRVNARLYPGLITGAVEWVTEGWRMNVSTPVTLATAILNTALASETQVKARKSMIIIAQNILNFYYRGSDWKEKPLPK